MTERSDTGSAQVDMYTAREVANRFRMSTRQIYRWVDDDKIPYVRIGRQLRFPAKQIDDLIANAA